MNKSIKFALNKFNTVPNKLRKIPAVDKAADEFTIDLARLYHHYYTDSYDVNPPDPNHANFEYLKFLAPCSDFRFKDEGIGSSTGKKRSVSSELAQAFCRYFLYEFLGITYFAHMDKVVNKELHPAFDGLKISRIDDGDVPDYLCAKKTDQPRIAESKGRYESINFGNSEFTKWRKQFKRISVRDKHYNIKKVKGFIVATKYTTEENRAWNKSKVYAEDPETNGDSYFDQDSFGTNRGCIAIHYSRLLSKLGLRLLSEALDSGFVVPKELSFNLPIWRCVYEPLKGQVFVGGFFSEIEPQMTKSSEGVIYFQPNVLKLGIPSPTFYGISVPVMEILRKICLGNWQLLSEIPELPDTDFRPSNLAWLRDGSISGGLDFFELVGTQVF